MIAENTMSGECAASGAADVRCLTSGLITANPGLAMLVVFGVGVCVGTLLSEAIPIESMRKVSETTAERIGRQICEALNIR